MIKRKKQTKKIVIWIAVIVVLLLLVMASFGMLKIPGKSNIGNSDNFDNSNIPQECRKPNNEDLSSWKEHLGHHENTKYCLGYYK